MEKTLHSILYNLYALYLKTQNYHWNIVGINFLPLHTLLDEHYRKLQDMIDELAEQIRKRDFKVKINFSLLKEESKLELPSEYHTWQEMVERLYKDHDFLRTQLLAAIKACGDDYSTQDMFVEFLHFHDKAYWMLKSHLQEK